MNDSITGPEVAAMAKSLATYLSLAAGASPYIAAGAAALTLLSENQAECAAIAMVATTAAAAYAYLLNWLKPVYPEAHTALVTTK